MAASDFWKALDRLGLSQYHDRLVQEAFDSWEVLADITEEDFDALDIKLEHRRIFQRAITESHRGRLQLLAIAVPPVRSKQRTPNSPRSVTSRGPVPHVSAIAQAKAGGKRRYRRHPKPDQNAPNRPLSAYVLFSNQTRDSLKGQDLSFTKIAKTVGERWQVLPLEEKAIYESRARTMKHQCHTQLAEYKRTQDYANHQEYLADFHVKYDHQLSTRKRRNGDYKSSPQPRRNRERGAGSPDGKEGSANYSEQSSGDMHLSGFRSPELPTRVKRPLSIQPANVLPNIAPSMLSPAFRSASCYTNKNLASINTPHSDATVVKSPCSLNDQPMSRVDDHPMAASMRLAYGNHPTLTGQGPSSTERPPLRKYTSSIEQSLPSLKHTGLLASSNPTDSSLDFCVPNKSGTTFSHGLSHQNRSPVSSRPSYLKQSLPPMRVLGSPNQKSIQPCGLKPSCA